jgi:hypothetical protein
VPRQYLFSLLKKKYKKEVRSLSKWVRSTKILRHVRMICNIKSKTEKRKKEKLLKKMNANVGVFHGDGLSSSINAANFLLAAKFTVSFSRRTLLHGVSWCLSKAPFWRIYRYIFTYV